MSDLKPLVLLPLPKGHVLRKEVDWIADCPRLISVNASAGMIVDAQDAGYTTYEHWPEDVPCPWVVRMNDEPVRRGGSEWPAACGVSVRRGGLQGPDEPGEGWRFLAPEEMPIEGDEFWSVGEWCPSHNWWGNEAQAPEMKYRRRVEPVSTIDAVQYSENVTLVADGQPSVEPPVPTELDRLRSQCERQAETIERLELLAAEYKARCEQLQDSDTTLRMQNERQITMVREEFARSSELLRATVGVLRWERRVPTEEECRTRWIAGSDAEIYPPGANAPEEYDDTDEICILPDILPAIEPPKTVTERLWFVQDASQMWKETWREEGKEPKGFHQIHKTEIKRERVVG